MGEHLRCLSPPANGSDSRLLITLNGQQYHAIGGPRRQRGRAAQALSGAAASLALTLAEPVAVDDVAGAVCAGVFGRNPRMSCDGTDEIKACAAAM